MSEVDVVGDLCSVVRVARNATVAGAKGSRFPLVIHESSFLSVSVAWIKPAFATPSSALLDPAGPGRRCYLDVICLSAFAVVLTSTSVISCVCRASPACSCFVFSSSNSSPAARGLLLEGMVEDRFKAAPWHAVSWEVVGPGRKPCPASLVPAMMTPMGAIPLPCGVTVVPPLCSHSWSCVSR